MAQFQSYNKRMVCQEPGITNVTTGGLTIGYEFYCLYPSYRGTFLSCIEDLRVYIDGQEVPQENMYFHVNGKQCLLSQFKDLYLEYWFVLDQARILVLCEGGLSAGSHEVKMTMKHRIPYTGYGGNCLVLDGENTKTLEVR